MDNRSTLRARIRKLLPQTCLLLGGLLLGHAGVAAGLGGATVHSAIGQPLFAEIPLLGDAPRELNCYKVTVPGSAARDELPWLRNPQLSIRSGSKPMLQIRTSRQISDPVLMLNLQVACGLDLTREFSLFIEAPVVASSVAAPAAPSATHSANNADAVPSDATNRQTNAMTTRGAAGESIQSLAENLYPKNKRAQRNFIREQLKAHPELTRDEVLPPGSEIAVLPPAYGGERRSSVETPSRSTKTEPKRARIRSNAHAADRSNAPIADEPVRVTERAAQATDRLVLTTADADLTSFVSTPPALRMELELGKGDAGLAAKRAQLLVEARLLAALDDLTAAEMSIADKIKSLEAHLAQLQQQSAAASQSTQTNAAQSAANVPTSAAKPNTVSTAALPAAVSNVTNRLGAEPSMVWIVGPAGFALLLLVSGWLYMRRRLNGLDDYSGESDSASIVDAAKPSATVVAATNPLERTVSILSPQLNVASSATPIEGQPSTSGRIDHVLDDAPLAVNDPHATEHAMEILPEHDSVVELAEIMLSFGRTQGAADTLSDFIRDNPREAVKPWLKLLEVYHHAGMRDQFEQLAPKLNSSFNVQTPSWDDWVSAEEPSSLEDYPHIMSRVSELWGTQEAADYLNGLLLDNRDGQRIGFPMHVVEEILSLAHIQQAQIANAAQAASPASASESIFTATEPAPSSYAAPEISALDFNLDLPDAPPTRRAV